MLLHQYATSCDSLILGAVEVAQRGFPKAVIELDLIALNPCWGLAAPVPLVTHADKARILKSGSWSIAETCVTEF